MIFASLTDVALAAPLAFFVGVFVGVYLGNHYVIIQKRDKQKDS